MAVSATVRNEMYYLATDTREVIQDVKTAAWRTLIGFTLAFAYLVSAQGPDSMTLSMIFLMGSILAAYFTYYVFPKRLGRRRELLRQLHKKYFSSAFRQMHNNMDTPLKEDLGDYMCRDFGTLYILVLLIIFLMQDTGLSGWL